MKTTTKTNSNTKISLIESIAWVMSDTSCWSILERTVIICCLNASCELRAAEGEKYGEAIQQCIRLVVKTNWDHTCSVCADCGRVRGRT